MPVGTPVDVSFWPEAAQIDVRLNVGCWGVSGLIVLTPSSSLLDPKRTLSISRAIRITPFGGVLPAVW
jgi:hypothetical protein